MCKKTTINTFTAESQHVEFLFDRVLHGQSLGFHFLLLI